MEHKFWHDRWESNTIGFHETSGNTFLRRFIDKLSLREGARIFVPLCGKTQDIVWLLSQGFEVAGAELSEIAVSHLFNEAGMMPTITPVGDLKTYSAPELDIFAGSIFNLTPEILRPMDGIFDRAALVALPKDMRIEYAKHMTDITQNAPQLLITFDYDQSLMPGPPFSISDAELEQHYGHLYERELLTCKSVKGRLKGKVEADEKVWLLSPKV